MSKKLLTKSTGNLLVFSIIILLISAPALYFMTNALYIQETDETLMLHKAEFIEDRLPGFHASDIETWNAYNRNVRILPYRHSKSDTVFTKIYFDALEDENEPYRELNGPIVIDGKTYTYQERNNLIEQEDLVMAVALLFLAVILMLLSGILIINKFASKRLWKPFYDTLDQIEGFELDKSKRPVFSATGILEFNRLNKSIDNLIDKNQTIYKTQKEFVENAAHELQTPLALFQAKIDTLFQSDGLTREHSLILDSLNNDVGRLNRLNKNLLLLSKIENNTYFETQRLSLSKMLERNLDFFSEQAKAKSLTLSIDIRSDVQIEANQALTEVLLNNLFLNAIRHNEKNGRIVAVMSDNRLTFSNTGASAPLDQGKLFNRFSKIDSSGQGNGLGLAIVRKITQINHWTISYDFDGGLHIFKVDFTSNSLQHPARTL